MKIAPNRESQYCRDLYRQLFCTINSDVIIFKISEYIRNPKGLEGFNFLGFNMGEMMVSVTNFLGMDVLVISGFDLGCTINFFGRNDHCRKHQNRGDDKRKVQHKMTSEY